MANRDLHNAKAAANDEFYTQLSDIEAELRHYKEQLRGKVIFCNCDDPFESNFFKYFASNFNHLGLKKLISTCYTPSPIAYTQLSIVGDNPKPTIPKRQQRPAYKIEIDHVSDQNGDGSTNIDDVKKWLESEGHQPEFLKENGDFRSKECIELLKQSDIVVTNPPFSLFREYVAQLVEYNKKFIIIGNMNATTYKEIFKLFMQNKIWLGVSIHSGDVEFQVPEHYEVRSKSYRVDPNGKRFIRVPSIRWFTNLDNEDRHEKLILYKKYTPDEYPKYDNYDAINVNKTADIPVDYTGVMGVPITFLDKYNPDQFEIISLFKGGNFENGTPAEIIWSMQSNGKENLGNQPSVNGKRVYARIIIKKKAQ